MMPNRSIQTSLSWWLAVQTLCCLVVTSAVIYLVAQRSFDEAQRSEIVRHEEMLRTLYRQAKSTDDWESLHGELTDFFRTHAELAVQLSRSGELLFSAGPDAGAPGWRQEQLAAPPDAPELELQMGVNVASDRAVLQTLAIALALVSLVASLVVSLTGARLVRRALAPLRSLAKETQAVGPQESGKRLDESGYGVEITPFVHQFNHMLERAEQAYKQLEAFNADVAHELRTPLANLIGEAEVELSQPRSAYELREVLMSNIEEARRMSAIVSDMLFLSRADRGVTARRVEVQSLRETVEEVVEFHDALLESKGLTVQIEGEAAVKADLGLVQRAISNLLGNAVRYATPGSQLLVRIRDRDQAVWCDMTNEGPAIPPVFTARLFERFYRVDRSRTGSNHGLGLAIVAAIARMHGGSTCATSSNGRTSISFSLEHQSTFNP